MADIPTLEGADLEEYTEKKPLEFAVIGSVMETLKSLKTGEPEQKEVLTIENSIGRFRWIPNGKSIKRMLFKFGGDRAKWPGRKVLLWTVKKDVFGTMKDVIYVSFA